MQPWTIELALAAVSFGAFFGLYGLMLFTSRPTRVAPLPAAQDLGPESPALASIVGNGWELTEEAVEATLVDLAARRVLEFRQPADDPFHTTIHVRQASPTGLNPYEQRVFDRVAGLAVSGVVPLTALPFRDQRAAKSWWKRVRAEIVAEARAKGISQRRFSPGQLLVLSLGAALATVGVDLAVAHWALRQPPSTNGDDDPWGMLIPATIFVFAGLCTFAVRDVGERDTPAGRAAAARWLGVKAWLHGHAAFSDLPPSAVATWDRYIGYGVALGASRVSSTVIDLGMGNRRRVWSSFGGTWRRVRISYPRLWPRYGQPASTLVIRALIVLAAGYGLTFWWRRGIDWVSAQVASVPQASLAGRVGVALGVALLGYGGYALLRAVIDASSRRTLTGQVLWKEVWRTNSGGDDSPRVPWLHYLAVDDGGDDQTRAWGIPANLEHRCDTGDTVTVQVRRWSRRVVDVAVVEAGTRGHRPGTDSADAGHERLVAEAGGRRSRSLLGAPEIAAGTLLTADEVGRALGFAVVQLDHAPLSGPMSGTDFRTADRKRSVLLLQVVDGPLGAVAWRANTRGQQVTGIGDGAWLNGNRAAARKGDTVVVLTLLGPGKGRGAQLGELLRQATDRVPVDAMP